MESTYPVTLLRRPGGFALHQPQLGLLVEGAELAPLYVEYAQQESTRLARYRELGVEIPPPPASSRAGASLKPFLTRAGIILVVLLIPTVLLAAAIREAPRVMAFHMPHALQRTMDAARMGLEGMVQRLEKMSPENRELLRQDLRRMAVGLEPVVSELRPLLGGSCPQPPPGKP